MDLDIFEILDTRMVINLAEPVINESKIDELNKAWAKPGYYIYVRYNGDYSSALEIIIYSTRKFNDSGENITSNWREYERLLRDEQIPAHWVMNVIKAADSKEEQNE